MKILSKLLVFVILVFVPFIVADAQETDQQIHEALLPFPESLRAGATVAGRCESNIGSAQAEVGVSCPA